MKWNKLLRGSSSILLCGILLFGCLGIVTAEESDPAGETALFWGDVDGDEEITSTDARLTLQLYADKIDESALNIAVADVDGDGTITSTDARLILQFYAGKIDRIGPPEPEPGETPVDLNGYEFTVVDFADNRFMKESNGSAYGNAWAQVMNEVERLYNCQITCTTLPASRMFTNIQPEIAAGGKYADLIIAPQWEYGLFVGSGLVTDLNNLNVNWDNEWWNQHVRDMATFNGKTYAASGSFLSDAPYTWALYYNERIWKENGFEDPYKLVDEGRWTQDLFAQYCRKAAKDRNESDMLDSYDDLWGVISSSQGDFCQTWYMALGGQYFETDPETGKIRVACNNQRTFNILADMFNMAKKDKTISASPYDNDTMPVEHFVNGGALFYAGALGTSGLQDMKDGWGILPLPKYDEAQEGYFSGVNQHAPVFGVTNTNPDTHEVAIVLEALGRHGTILEDIYWPDYEETYWRHEEDARMVSEYVVGHGRYDAGLLFQNCNAVFRAPVDRVGTTVFAGHDFASWINAVEPVIEVTIADYFGYY